MFLTMHRCQIPNHHSWLLDSVQPCDDSVPTPPMLCVVIECYSPEIFILLLSLSLFSSFLSYLLLEQRICVKVFTNVMVQLTWSFHWSPSFQQLTLLICFCLLTCFSRLVSWYCFWFFIRLILVFTHMHKKRINIKVFKQLSFRAAV